MVLVLCLLLSLFVVSCQKDELTKEEQIQIVIENAEVVMDNVTKIYELSSSVDEMAQHLSEIKAMANVEDAWKDDIAICVKIKEGGVIMWCYYPKEENIRDTFDAEQLFNSIPKSIPSKNSDALCEEKSLCLLNVFYTSEIEFESEQGDLSYIHEYKKLLSKFKELGWKLRILHKNEVTPKFIVDSVPKYGVSIISTHGGYFDNMHWLLTGLNWRFVSTLEGWDEWKDDFVRIDYYCRRSNSTGSVLRNSSIIISEAYIDKYLSDRFFDNSLLFLDACSTLKGNDSFWKKLRKKGLGCLVGFNESIYSYSANKCALAFFTSMLKGATASEACSTVRSNVSIEGPNRVSLLCCPDSSNIIFIEKQDALFSVSPTQQVCFSTGNLQYQPSTNIWRFAEHQYDFIGEDNVNCIIHDPENGWIISTTYGGWIDLFGWGTGNNPTFLSQDTRHNDYPTFVDWGTNNISNNGCEGWRTLSKDEWYYLFYTRTGASEKCGSGNINGINGIVLLPDNWTLPEGCTFISGMNGWANNNYTLTQWEDMEDEGAIFFPAACSRNYWHNYGGGQGGIITSYYVYGDASQQESWNGYWSSTPNNFNMDGAGITAFSLIFKSSEVSACRTGVGYYSGFCPRNMGLSVRLARDIEQE